MSTPITTASRAASSTSAKLGTTAMVRSPPHERTTIQPARQPSTPTTGVITASRSGAARRLRGEERLVHERHQRDDVEDGPAGLPLDLGGVRRHVRALEHDGADVGMLADQPARDAHVLLTCEVDVELELVVEQRAG